MNMVQRGQALQSKLDDLETNHAAAHAELTRVWNLTVPLVTVMAAGLITGLTHEARLDLIAFERLINVLAQGTPYYQVDEDIRLGS